MRCIQQDWFGFYAMRVAARSVLQSINFLSAAALSAENDLNAPAVANAYAGSFLLLHAYLALEGRVYCESASDTGDPAPVMVVLSRGKWAVDGSKRARAAR